MLTKPLPIVLAFKSEIEAALQVVNGRSTRHCFNRYDQIECDVVADVEQRLQRLRLPKYHWKAVTFYATSGTILAKSYRGTPNATSIVLRHRSNRWVIVEVALTKLYPGKSPPRCLVLGPDQADVVLQHFAAENFRTRKRTYEEHHKIHPNSLSLEEYKRIGGEVNEEVRAWLDEHAPGWTEHAIAAEAENSETIAINLPDENAAFHFRMRWR